VSRAACAGALNPAQASTFAELACAAGAAVAQASPHGLRHLRPSPQAVKIPVITGQFGLPTVRHAFDTAGQSADPRQREQMDKRVQQLIDEVSSLA
jgi:NAD(P)H-dependent FMN reductase